MIHLATNYPKARKRHICDAFPFDGHGIEAGEVYSSYRGICDDGPYTFKSCAYHTSIIHTMIDTWPQDYPEGPTDEDVREQLYEWWGDAAEHAERGLPFPTPFDPRPEGFGKR